MHREAINISDRVPANEVRATSSIGSIGLSAIMSRVQENKVSITSHFLVGDKVREELEELFGEHVGENNRSSVSLRLRVHGLMKSAPAEAIMAFVVIADFCCIWISTDATASDQDVPTYMNIFSSVAFCLYIFDFAMIVFVRRHKALDSLVQRVNLLLILLGLGEMVVEAAGFSSLLGSTRILRLLRVMRMIRILEKFAKIKELRALLQMAAGCGKCLAWTFIFCFCILIMWSVIAVELIHPVVQDLVRRGEWESCIECQEAFSSVIMAALTFFKTTIAGDSWGIMAIPVIRESPGLAFIFVGSSLTVVNGILTFSSAVVIDTFSEQRQKDEKVLAEELEIEADQDVAFWSRIFGKLDEDGNGELDLRELMHGARKMPLLRSRLRVMDIDEADLSQLFMMLDADGGGTVDLDEFVNALTRWRRESKTASRFSKYNLQRVLAQQGEIMDTLEAMTREVRDAGDIHSRRRRHKKAVFLGSGSREVTDVEAGSGVEDSDVPEAATSEQGDVTSTLGDVDDAVENKLQSLRAHGGKLTLGQIESEFAPLGEDADGVTRNVKELTSKIRNFLDELDRTFAEHAAQMQRGVESHTAAPRTKKLEQDAGAQRHQVVHREAYPRLPPMMPSEPVLEPDERDTPPKWQNQDRKLCIPNLLSSQPTFTDGDMQTRPANALRHVKIQPGRV